MKSARYQNDDVTDTGHAEAGDSLAYAQFCAALDRLPTPHLLFPLTGDAPVFLNRALRQRLNIADAELPPLALFHDMAAYQRLRPLHHGLRLRHSHVAYARMGTGDRGALLVKVQVMPVDLADRSGWLLGAVEPLRHLSEVPQDPVAFDTGLARVDPAPRLGIWILNIASGALTTSGAFAAIHEAAPDFQPDLNTFINFFVPAVRDIVRSVIEYAIATGESWEVELPFITAAGRHLWVRLVGYVELDAADQPIRLWGTLQDITERKYEENSLRLREQHASAAFHSVADSMLLVEADGTIIEANASALRMFDYTALDLIGQSFGILMPAPYNPLPEQFFSQYHYEQTVAPGSTSQELSGLRRDGTVFPMSLAVGAFNIDGEEVYSVLIHDITRRREADQHALELRMERERVELLSSFVTSASHEFRTPLAVINSSLYMLRRSDPDQQGHYAAKIEDSIAYLSELLDGMMTCVRLDQGSPLNLSQVDINLIMRGIVSALEDAAHSQKVKLLTLYHPRLPRIQAEGALLARALGNLVHNALRFTPQAGTIQIETRALADEIQVLIRDEGVGMTPFELERAFERFYRADTARTTRGLGLGLPIARQIIEAHGGSIRARSQPNEGSEFIITLPRDRDG
ncbi:MAG: PAS domain-containing sensor histidine kinase [Chloroflexota bacterium]